jgi:MFS family permease
MNQVPPEIDGPQGAPHPARIWTAGTLVYGAGSLIALFLLLLAGDFAWSMKERSVVAMLQLALHSLGTSERLLGLLTGTIPALVTIALTPVVGVWSDRARTRWGRRIPFLLVPTPVIILAMVGIAFARTLGPWLNHLAGGSPAADAAWTIGLLAVLWTVFEVFTITANAVFNALVNDVVPRAVIGRFFGLFRSVSLIAGIIFNYRIIGSAEAHFELVFLGIAAIYGVGFGVMCLFVKEGSYPPPPPRATVGWRSGIAAYLRECGSSRYYLMVCGVIALGMTAMAPVNLFSLYAAKSFGMSVDSYGKHIAVTYVCSLLLAFPLGWLTDRFHPMITGAVALGCYAVAMAVSFVAIHDAGSFGIAFVVHGVVSGAYFTTTAGLGLMLFPRLQFSQFASAALIATSLCGMVLAPSLGWLLELSGHEYRCTFLVGSLIATAGVGLWLALYRRFARHGGPRGYQAPPAVAAPPAAEPDAGAAGAGPRASH